MPGRTAAGAPWRRRVDRAAGVLERMLDACVGSMILVMTAAICWQVFGRYVLSSAPGWSEELSRYLMIWVTTIGGAAVLRSGGHLSVTALLDALPPAWATALLALRDVAMLATLLLLAWWGLAFSELMAVQETASLQVSKAWVYAALPVGTTLTALLLVMARLAGRTFRATDVDVDDAKAM
ncbi:MAG: TRAP transporter small permease [Alphaproteobacteria bacterium]|nr:TRAP transporter small permease [Alphaproteobacteria bacterium]